MPQGLTGLARVWQHQLQHRESESQGPGLGAGY